MAVPVVLIWLLLTVLAIQHNGWGMLFVSLGIAVVVALPWAMNAWQQSNAVVPETVAVAADVPPIKEFLAAVGASALPDEQKKRLRLKAIRDLPGAYRDYTDEMNNLVPKIADFIAAVKASGLAEEAKKRLRLKAIRDLPGAYEEYLEATGYYL